MTATLKKTEYLAMREGPQGKTTIVGTIGGCDKYFCNSVIKSTGHGCSHKRGGGS